MKENKAKKVSKKQMSIATGFLLMLFSVALIINSGYPIRVFSFVPFYLFGAGSYLIYLLIYFEGVNLLRKQKLISLKPLRKTFGLIISFIGINLLLTVIGHESGILKNDFFNEYQSLYDNLTSNYITCPLKELFGQSLKFGGGLFGFSIVGSLNTLFDYAGLVFGIIILVLGVFLLVYPLIKKMITSIKNKTQESKKADLSKKPSIESIHVETKTKKEKIINIDPVKGANIIPDDYKSEIAEIRPVLDNQFGEGGRVSNIYSSNFRKVKYGTNGEAIINANRKPGTLEPAHYPGFKKIDREPEVELEEKTNSFEQIELDFEGKESNEEMLIQPTFKYGSSKSDNSTKSDKLEVVKDAKEPYFEPLMEQKETQNTVPHFEPVSQPTFKKEPDISSIKEEEKVIQEPVKRERVVWVAPDETLLDTYETSEASEKNRRTAEERSQIINNAFIDFKVGAKVEDYTIGPSVTRYNIRNESNVLVRQVGNIIDDIAIRLGGVSCRFEKLIEGQTTSGIEVPNTVITTVGFNEVFTALPDVKKHPLAFGFGKNINGEIVSADLNKCPHMLISGTTGSGKSIFVNSIITTLIMRNSPDDLKMVLVDPKKVEMARYADMPHLLCPIITEAEEAKLLVEKLVEEMETRYNLFAHSNGATDIGEYNEDCEITGKEPLPYIVVILDEYADIVDNCKEISMPVVTLAAKARACGIHLIIATQRPSANVVTGVIKANLPTHVALMTGSATDSIVIIGEGGAEKLLGKGDMLVQSPLVSRVGVVRLQGCFISRKEAIRVVGDLKNRYETVYDPKYLNLMEASKKEAEAYASTPEFQSSIENGEEGKYQSIKEWVMSQQYMSISRIQRECGVGFNRAGRFFLRLQNEGVVDTSTDGNKGCRVLVNDSFDDDDDNIPTSIEQTSFGEE